MSFRFAHIWDVDQISGDLETKGMVVTGFEWRLGHLQQLQHATQVGKCKMQPRKSWMNRHSDKYTLLLPCFKIMEVCVPRWSLECSHGTERMRDLFYFISYLLVWNKNWICSQSLLLPVEEQPLWKEQIFKVLEGCGNNLHCETQKTGTASGVGNSLINTWVIAFLKLFFIFYFFKSARTGFFFSCIWGTREVTHTITGDTLALHLFSAMARKPWQSYGWYKASRTQGKEEKKLWWLLSALLCTFDATLVQYFPEFSKVIYFIALILRCYPLYW